MSISRQTFSSFLSSGRRPDLRSISFSVFLTTSSSLSEKNRTTWLENKAGFLKNKGLVSSSGAKHIEENDSVSFCLAKSQVLFPVVITPYANNILVHFFN